ncbi:chaperonin 10-like protein [Paraphoma chrysanthemicola]|uniref:Chaperonin 10-like protein n=1 Tax=Paraphoma chrysanthemicola TaxID=798071 RepID=A0A8K0RF99_9PLEO|nr:chaperonin 10-like protein [Paraphoma chrysanthemicola]
MPLKTKALVLNSIKGQFELREIVLDDLRPEEALVEIQATGICHTDLSCATGLIPCSAPIVLGHEGCGVVLETGSEVSNVSKGDKVVLSFSHCENCRQCTEGRPAYCYKWHARNFSGQRADGSITMRDTGSEKPLSSPFFGQSSFAKHTVVHRSCLVRVPPSSKAEIFAPMGCGVQTGAGAVLNSLRVRPGSSLVVFGAGSVGICAVMAGKLAQATTIIAVDIDAQRLEVAKDVGATHVILATKDLDVVSRIKEICPPNGVDFAVDCTGVPSVVAQMVESLGTLGRATQVGVPGFGSKVPVDILDHLTFGKEYVGCSMGGGVPSKLIPYLIDMHAKGLFPIEKLVTRYRIEEFENALQDMKSGKTIKAVLTWD